MTTTDSTSDPDISTASDIGPGAAPAPAGPPPPAVALQLASGFIASQAVYSFTKLKLADALAEGPRPADAVANRVGTDRDRTRRLLRTLAGFGVVNEVAADTFQLTEVGQLFCNEPGSLADLTTMWIETHYDAFAGFAGTVKTGEPAFDTVKGQDYWSWLEGKPAVAELFSRAMGSFGTQTQTAAIGAFDFSRFERVVDVGGAHGSFLAAVLSQSQTSTGVLFDLPHVIATAEPFLAASDVFGRVECIAGDFFESVPTGGDAYLLSLILHDWDNADCLRILTSIRRAIPANAVLLILENVIPAGNDPHLGKVIDMIMMTILRGTERTRAEYEALLVKAGFDVVEVIPTEAPTSLIVARPV